MNSVGNFKMQWWSLGKFLNAKHLLGRNERSVCQIVCMKVVTQLSSYFLSFGRFYKQSVTFPCRVSSYWLIKQLLWSLQ